MTVKKLTEEQKQVIADSKWWKEFGDRFGWRLHGFSYRNTASFFTGPNRILQITADERNQIAAQLRSKQ